MASRLLIIAFVSLLAAAFSGCGRSKADDADASTGPKTLVWAYSVSEEELVESRTENYAIFAKYLSEQLKMPVETVRTTGYAVNIEAMRSGKIHLASFSPLPYLLARQKAGIHPLVGLGRRDGSPYSYNSLLVTHPGTGVKSIDHLKAKASGLTLAFANPASTSGHLIPRSFLESEGLIPEQSFKRVLFSENHVVSVMNVRSGKIDVAAVSRNLVRRMMERGDLKPDELSIVWESPPLLISSLSASRELPSTLREAVLAALLKLPEALPEVWKEHISVYADTDLVYRPIYDGMFDEYRRIARNIENLKLYE